MGHCRLCDEIGYDHTGFCEDDELEDHMPLHLDPKRKPPKLGEPDWKRVALAYEAALYRINALIDSPARFNSEVQAVLDSVIDTRDVNNRN